MDHPGRTLTPRPQRGRKEQAAGPGAQRGWAEQATGPGAQRGRAEQVAGPGAMRGRREKAPGRAKGGAAAAARGEYLKEPQPQIPPTRPLGSERF